MNRDKLLQDLQAELEKNGATQYSRLIEEIAEEVNKLHNSKVFLHSFLTNLRDFIENNDNLVGVLPQLDVVLKNLENK